MFVGRRGCNRIHILHHGPCRCRRRLPLIRWFLREPVQFSTDTLRQNVPRGSSRSLCRFLVVDLWWGLVVLPKSKISATQGHHSKDTANHGRSHGLRNLRGHQQSHWHTTTTLLPSPPPIFPTILSLCPPLFPSHRRCHPRTRNPLFLWCYLYSHSSTTP